MENLYQNRNQLHQQTQSGSSGMFSTAEPFWGQAAASDGHSGPGPPSMGLQPGLGRSLGGCTLGALPRCVLTTACRPWVPGSRPINYFYTKTPPPSPPLAWPEVHEGHKGQAGSGRSLHSAKPVSSSDAAPPHPTAGPIKFFVSADSGTGEFKPACASAGCTPGGGLEPPVSHAAQGQKAPAASSGC